MIGNGLRLNQDMRQLGLVLARLFWLGLLLAILFLFYSGLPVRYEQILDNVDARALIDLGISVQTYALFQIVMTVVLVMVHHLIAAIIFIRRTDDWTALLVSLALFTNGALVPLSQMYLHTDTHPAVTFLVNTVIYLAIISSVVLLYTFPDGHFVPAWTRPLVLVWAVLGFPSVFYPESQWSHLSFPLIIQITLWAAYPLTGIISQVYRYENVSSSLQRQQAKWAMFGLVAAMLGPLAYFIPQAIPFSFSAPEIPNMLYQRLGSEFFTIAFLVRLVGSTIFNVSFLLFPLSFAVAIMRYRLWDIDLLINRALVYTILTGTLALVYFASIIFLQGIFRSLTGQNRSTFVTVISTLIIAALSTPFRQRIQLAIDRRFYRRKYDVQKTLLQFGDTLREEVDLHELSDRLLAVVQDSMQPANVSLWLRPVDMNEVLHTNGNNPMRSNQSSASRFVSQEGQKLLGKSGEHRERQ